MSIKGVPPAPAAEPSPAPPPLPRSFDLSDPIPLENDALSRAQEVTIGVLLGLPALFSGVLPRLFAVAAEANSDELAVLFFAFSAAYFTLPLAYIALRGSGWEVWKRSGMIALLGALSITFASLFVAESTLVRLASFALSLAGVSFLALLAFRRFVPRHEKPFIRTDELRGIRTASTPGDVKTAPEDKLGRVSISREEMADPPSVPEPAPVKAADPFRPAPSLWKRTWDGAPGASFGVVGLLAALGLVWMWAGPTGFLTEIRDAFALADVIENAREDNDAARTAVANASRPLNPAYLLTTRDTSAAASDRQSVKGAANSNKQDLSSALLLRFTKELADSTRIHLGTLTLLEDSAAGAKDGARVRSINAQIAASIAARDDSIRAETLRLDAAVASYDGATNARAANVALRLREARRAWNDLATRPAVDSAGRSAEVTSSLHTGSVTAAENAWDQFLADWTDEQAAYLRLRQEQQRHLQDLLELKTKSAQRRLTAIYERVRVRGLVMLSIALAWLLFTYYRQFSRLPEGHKLSLYGEYRKQSYLIAFAFLVILIVPLLPRLQEAKVDPTRPIESFTMRSWYLPGFLTQEVSEEFMEAGGLPSRGGYGVPSAGSTSILPLTVRVDTAAARPDTIDHRGAIQELAREIGLTNQIIGRLEFRMDSLQNDTRGVRDGVSRVEEKVDPVTSIWDQVKP